MVFHSYSPRHYKSWRCILFDVIMYPFYLFNFQKKKSNPWILGNLFNILLLVIYLSLLNTYWNIMLIQYFVITYFTKFSLVQKGLPFKKCSIFDQQNVCFSKVIDLIRCKCDVWPRHDSWNVFSITSKYCLVKVYSFPSNSLKL